MPIRLKCLDCGAIFVRNITGRCDACGDKIKARRWQAARDKKRDEQLIKEEQQNAGV